MALLDALFEFSDNQTITNADVAATNVLDMQAANLEMGAGTPIYLNVRVGTAFAGGTNITVNLVSETDATIDGSSIITLTSQAFTTATTPSLAAGQWLLRVPLPVNFDENRYVGVYYTRTGTFTAGTVNAWLDNGPQSSYDTQVTTSNI
jgi:hypothetical protein